MSGAHAAGEARGIGGEAVGREGVVGLFGTFYLAPV